MATNYLTPQHARDVLQYNPETGQFCWLKGRRRGRVAGGGRADGYWRVTIGENIYLAHRLAWFMVHGCWPKYHIDHRDGNPANNALDNLRDVPRAINGQNTWRARINNASGVLGASWNHKSKAWHAAICTNGRRRFLGSFKTAADAHQAYMTAKLIDHGLP